MFYKIHKFLFLILCACFFGTASYAENNAIIRKSSRLRDARNGDNSGQIFSDVEYLKELLESIGWENSADPQRKELYLKLVDAVKDIESYEESKIQELRDAAAEAKEREQSTANKMLGGMAIGTMGLSGMELASAVSEKQAMEDAEQAMRAYLATFVCRYDSGKSVRGGEIDVELPGGNDLLPLVTEYKQLAADLKSRKEALGIAPGIESETILDKASNGLYDDEGLEKSGGAFISVSRALMDETSKDATEWSADKEAVDKKIKTSAAVAAAAAVASVAANLAINGGKQNAVVSKADTTRQEVKKILDDIIANCNAAIEGTEQTRLIDYEDLKRINEIKECQ